jgi:hypothetical protein
LDISVKSGKRSSSDDGEADIINRQLKQTQEQSEGCERQLENIVRQANQEISKLSAKVQGVFSITSGMAKDSEFEKRKTHELVEQMNSKNRQFLKLQTMFDKLKRKLAPNSVDKQQQPLSFMPERSVTPRPIPKLNIPNSPSNKTPTELQFNFTNNSTQRFHPHNTLLHNRRQSSAFGVGRSNSYQN